MPEHFRDLKPQTLDELAAFMDRHQRVALLFSAGKDSAACLKLLRELLVMQNVTVIWANPGRPYPAVVDYMARIRRSVPRFVEARGDQPAWVEANGYPADLLPWEATPVGRACLREHAGRPLSSPDACRWANMWEPALHAVRASGASGIIKGEKLVDRPLPPSLPRVFEGREYHRPLLAWTDAEVLGYLGAELPPGYAEGLTGSLDCMTCTAFLARNPDRLAYLARVNPAAYAEVLPVLRYMRRAAAGQLDLLDRAINRGEGP